MEEIYEAGGKLFDQFKNDFAARSQQENVPDDKELYGEGEGEDEYEYKYDGDLEAEEDDLKLSTTPSEDEVLEQAKLDQQQASEPQDESDTLMDEEDMEE